MHRQFFSFSNAFSALIVSGCAAIVPAISHAAPLTPISLTGWNQDVIAEATAASPFAGTTTDYQGTVGAGDWVWYEKGAPLSSQGLPNGGSFVSAFNSNVTFQYQPYTANNSLLDTGTVTLTTPASYQTLAFLHNAQNGNNKFEATLHFSDNSQTVLAYANPDPDWINNTSYNAISNIGLIGRNTTWTGFYTGTLNMFEHDFTLSAADQAKTLVSIGWATTGGGHQDLFAVSGEASALPEPGSLALVGLASTTLLMRRRKA